MLHSTIDVRGYPHEGKRNKTANDYFPIGGRGELAWTSSTVAAMVVNSSSAKMSFQAAQKRGKMLECPCVHTNNHRTGTVSTSLNLFPVSGHLAPDVDPSKA